MTLSVEFAEKKGTIDAPLLSSKLVRESDAIPIHQILRLL